jgi:hypothetical protein
MSLYQSKYINIIAAGLPIFLLIRKGNSLETDMSTAPERMLHMDLSQSKSRTKVGPLYM